MLGVEGERKKRRPGTRREERGKEEEGARGGPGRRPGRACGAEAGQGGAARRTPKVRRGLPGLGRLAGGWPGRQQLLGVAGLGSAGHVGAAGTARPGLLAPAGLPAPRPRGPSTWPPPPPPTRSPGSG